MEPAEALDRLRAELDVLDHASEPGLDRRAAARRSRAYDVALTGMFAALDPPDGLAMVAVGGYGRERQFPRSDVDLLLVHDESAAESAVAFAERLLYPLWDAGFDVGHAVRTPGDCVEISHRHLDAWTGMLDLRFLAGDEGLAGDVARRVLDLATRDPRGFAAALEADAEGRADRIGSAAHLLEPDLKSGAGGLRDIQTIGWLRRAGESSGEVDEEPGGWQIRGSERRALEDADAFLTRVRSALQLETGKRSDKLPLELQPAIARALGFADEPRLIAEDALMRAVFEHARSVRWIQARAFAAALGRGSEEGSADQVVGPPRFDGPADLLEALALVAERGERPPPPVLDAIERTPLAVPDRWTGPMREAFLRILRSGDAGVDVLDALDRLEVLAALIPAWTDVRCRPQRDPYHRFTVDAHLTAALRRMGRMLTPPASQDPSAHEDQLEREMVAQIDDPEGLLLGALLHDIGKVGEGGHVAIGTRIATATLDRMTVEDPTRSLALFMIEHHLLLPDTATRRDLTDEGLIADLADTIGTPERLAALYLLAKADAMATGPAAWTSWRRTLVRELVTRIRRAFDRGAGLADRLADRLDRIRELLAGEPDDAVQRFVLRMPRAYFLAVDPPDVARHYGQIAPPVGSVEVRSSAADGARAGSYELLVVAADRPGLLSWIAGSLALAGLSILTAQAFTTDDGVAVDLFEVEGVFEPTVDEARWREVRRSLRAAVEGRTSLVDRVAEKRGRYPAPALDRPVRVHVDNDASAFSSVIEVAAPDRLGLLFDITSALADLRLDVHLAKVATYTDRVVDTFYVRDASGAKITDPDQISEIGSTIRERCED